MSNYKTIKWCAGVTLCVSLSACNMWGTEPDGVVRPAASVKPAQSMSTNYEPAKSEAKVVVSKPKAVQKTYATKDPSQKATPGPVRKAAPQLPVIQ